MHLIPELYALDSPLDLPCAATTGCQERMEGSLITRDRDTRPLTCSFYGSINRSFTFFFFPFLLLKILFLSEDTLMQKKKTLTPL